MMSDDERADLAPDPAAARLRTIARSHEECEALLRLSVSFSGVGCWRHDVATGRLSWSDEVFVIHGAAPQSFAPDARSAWSFYAPEDRALAMSRIATALRGRGSFAFELPLIRADGSKARIACEGTCVTRDGAPVALLGAVQDVTDPLLRTIRLERLTRRLAVARDQAERSSEAKSRFLTAMSHELRTPLHGIIGYAQLLQLEGGLNARQTGRIEAMLLAGEHLLPMINSVLDVAEIETGHVKVRTEAVDLQHLMRTCLDLILPAAEKKSLKLAVVIPKGSPQKLIADPTRLRQVLLNLLGNAVKYTAAGSVSLRFLKTADGAGSRLEVADTGPGIPADRRAQLFKDFDRLGAESNSLVEGAGLGLAISAKLASLMGGRLGHEDNAGGGSVFWLELPRSAEIAAPALPSETVAAKARPASAGVARVLVVDDVAMNREIAAAFLQSAGYATSFATGGPEALAMATEQDFDLALMDVCMPEMDGLEVTRRIRALPGPRGRLPIVALTAQTFNDQVDACRKTGMNLHLTKPFTCKALLDAVAQALSLGAQAPSLGAQALSLGAAGPDPAPLPDAAAAATTKGPPARPVCDHAVFEQTTSYVSRDDAKGYLRTLMTRSGELRRRLEAPTAAGRDASSEEAAAAHVLAGSAGMFGFERLASTSRLYERSIEVGSPDREQLARDMIAALDASLEVMRMKLDMV
jgi:signal transduction histidine kinase/CheY-like chemotaxis protein/HPt (histidine-containing phosphotransfer) domain-containing protein